MWRRNFHEAAVAAVFGAVVVVVLGAPIVPLRQQMTVLSVFVLDVAGLVAVLGCVSCIIQCEPISTALVWRLGTSCFDSQSACTLLALVAVGVSVSLLVNVYCRYPPVLVFIRVMCL